MNPSVTPSDQSTLKIAAGEGATTRTDIDSALFTASKTGSAADVIRWLDRGADPASSPWRSHTLYREKLTRMEAAAELGDPEMILNVLSNDPDEATLAARAKRVAVMSNALNRPTSVGVIRAWLVHRETSAALGDIEALSRCGPHP